MAPVGRVELFDGRSYLATLPVRLLGAGLPNWDDPNDRPGTHAAECVGVPPPEFAVTRALAQLTARRGPPPAGGAGAKPATPSRNGAAANGREPNGARPWPAPGTGLPVPLGPVPIGDSLRAAWLIVPSPPSPPSPADGPPRWEQGVPNGNGADDGGPDRAGAGDGGESGDEGLPTDW
jgi:hypothetical protein